MNYSSTNEDNDYENAIQELITSAVRQHEQGFQQNSDSSNTTNTSIDTRRRIQNTNSLNSTQRNNNDYNSLASSSNEENNQQNLNNLDSSSHIQDIDDDDEYNIEKHKINIRRPPNKGGYGQKKMNRSLNPLSLNQRQKVVNGFCTDRQGRMSVCKKMINRYNFKDAVETNYLSAAHICGIEISIGILKESTIDSVKNYINATVRFIMENDAFNTVGSPALGRFVNTVYFILREMNTFCTGRSNIVEILSYVYSEGNQQREIDLQNNLNNLIEKYKRTYPFNYNMILTHIMTIIKIYKFSPEINAFVPEGNNKYKRYRIRSTGVKPTVFDKYVRNINSNSVL